MHANWHEHLIKKKGGDTTIKYSPICLFVCSYGSMPFTRMSKVMGNNMDIPYIKKENKDFTDRNI